MMDNFEIESSDYDSLQSDDDMESRSGSKLKRSLTRKNTIKSIKSRRSLVEDSSPNKVEKLSTLERTQQELNERHKNYMKAHQETLVNFEENIKMLSQQSEHLTGVVEELNRGQV